MKIKVQLVVCAEDGCEEQVQEITIVGKPHQRIEHLGLTLAEAKAVLKMLQQHLVEQQATAFVAAHAQCDHCGKSLGIKGHHTRTFRTLFGIVPHQSATLSLSLPASQDDHLPAAERPADQNHTLAVAQRCEDELGEEPWAFVEGCPADWAALPLPDGPMTVGIDGGYIRNWEEKQQLTFLSDGGDTMRELQLSLTPHAEHLLGWFHLAMRLTVLQQTARGLPQMISVEDETYRLRDTVGREFERLKWFLWHGNVYRAFQVVESVEMDLDGLCRKFSFEAIWGMLSPYNAG